MQRYVNYLAGTTGQPVQGASVTVLTYPGAIPATLFSDNGVTPTPNPLTTDASGGFSFYAADGHYTLSFTGSGITPTTINDVIMADVLPGDLAVASSVGATDAVRVDQGGVMKTATPGLVNTIANGGTGASTQATALANILGSSLIPVANGGTGRATLTARSVLIGEGTAAVNQVVPSTAGQALISAGAAADPVFGFPTGALIGVQKFTSSGTYTPTPGATSAIIYGTGGGGGGGGGAATSGTTTAMGGTGAAGSWGVARITSLSSQTVTIGSAGNGGAAGANAGATGGQTSIGTLLVCPGGIGGVGGPATAFANTTVANNSASPGADPTSSGTLLYGSKGQVGTVQQQAYNGTGVLFGAGGSGPFGSGGFAGANAGGFGAGGGAAALGGTAAAQAGGNASAGLILIYEYA